MKIELEPVAAWQKEILLNLLEKYDYEFSQWDRRDVNPLGLYGYSWLDYYWTEKNRWPFFIRVDGQLAGFAMVNDYPEDANESLDYAMSEFFVMFKYRRLGVGAEAAAMLFRQFSGRWQLKRHPHNLPSVAFWDKVVGRADPHFRINSHGEPYDDGTPGEVLYFNT